MIAAQTQKEILYQTAVKKKPEASLPAGMSLRATARELGVSPSYLSQVLNGKRPPSAKLLNSPLLSVKQNLNQIKLASSEPKWTVSRTFSLAFSLAT